MIGKIKKLAEAIRQQGEEIRGLMKIEGGNK